MNIKVFSCFFPFSLTVDWQQILPARSELMYFPERIVKRVRAFFDSAQKVFCPSTSFECAPLFSQRQMYLFCCHACHLSCRQVIAKNKIAVNSIQGSDIGIQHFPAIHFSQPVTQPLQAEQTLAGIAFFSHFHGHTPEGFDIQVKTGFARIGVVVKNANVINVGRQLIVCIHKCSFRCVMDKNRLPVRSDRGRQTYRSENSRAVTGSLSLTTVRPTPTIHIPKKIIYLHGGNRAFRINGGLFNA
ncbi:hypothetical protein HMPREF0693_2787 [Proteus mirabilis ATCC 29906]|uniref:Uncharacterized protein n=2 Tax=Enterobacterales TaxID=91347 RepID=B4EY09_PROMH|nr:hypothetical protein HMPREF0693_2787 [Proteus mirabilis ATCC 29906]KXC01202.1 hypothetical protein HMPREF3203_01228 [Proteus mirabilis]CAR45208.1 conserved hypothetical protein [Proteus mirabilis HI4320]